ncbi:MAG: putative Ig domain-containing protein [Woeseiaceae bacterium]
MPFCQAKGAGMQSKFRLIFLVGTTLVLSACFDPFKGSGTIPANDGVNPPPSALNNPPTIAGTPPPIILEGEPYEFTPAASDPDGDTLEFTISRKPSWATFDRVTGRLSGTPDAEDVGNYTNIGITVSDGQASAALTGFHITVDQIALGTATLSWAPPTENADGSALINLAGYKIYYGLTADQLTRTIAIDNPGLTRYMVENLSPAKWHFAMTSVNSSGVESNRTTTVSKTIT